MRTLLATALVAALLSLISCSTNHPSEPVPDPIVEPDTHDQLIPLSVGNWWKYHSSGDDVVHYVDGFSIDSVVSVFNAPSVQWDNSFHLIAGYPASVWYGVLVEPNHSLACLSQASRGIKMGYQPRGAMVDTVASYEYPVLPQHSNEWDTIEAFGSGLRMVWVDRQTISVPAGTFINTDHFHDFVGLHYDVWFKTGVGMIRSTKMKADSSLLAIRELESYHVKQ